MMAVVVDPGFAEHLLAEAAGPVLVAPVVLDVGAVLVLGITERVRRRAQAQDRLARIHELVDVLHVAVRQFAEPRGDDHHVGGLQGLQAGDVVLVQRIDRPVRRVDGEQHGTLEAVVDGQDLAQHRQGFLGTVLLVAADQHDVLALARPFFPFVHDPRILGPSRQAAAERQCPQNDSAQFRCHRHVATPPSLGIRLMVARISRLTNGQFSRRASRSQPGAADCVTKIAERRRDFQPAMFAEIPPFVLAVSPRKPNNSADNISANHGGLPCPAFTSSNCTTCA